MENSSQPPRKYDRRRRSSLEKGFAVSQIAEVVRAQQAFIWLAEQKVVSPRVAHFGCRGGVHTLGLMGAVQANHAVGVHSDPQQLLDYRDRLLRLKWDLRKFWERLQKSDSLPASEFSWWNRDVPDFVKNKLLDEDFMIAFEVGSLPERNPLEEQHFDLVVSDFSLHRIWRDRNRPDAEHETRVAVGKLKKNLRLGGHLGAVEMIGLAGQQQLDFRLLFEQLELKVLFVEPFPLKTTQGRGLAARFLCQKTD